MNTDTPDIDVEKSLPTGYTIYLTGEINQELADAVTKEMLGIDIQNKSKGENAPITLIINSPGGELNAGWQICDIMDFISTPVYTTGLGEIASAALMVFMNGEKGRRILSDRTTIMSHRYSWGVMGNHAQLIAVQSEIKNLHEKIVRHYMECTGLSKTVIENELLKPYDVWLSPRRAKKYKIADKIFITKKSKSLKTKMNIKKERKNGSK
jgi:ATP-dependent Clp protease protease subunit